MAFLRIMVLLWADMLATYVMWIMQTYLTNVWKLGFTHAAGIMNIYTGLTKFLPLVLFIFVDAGLGNYWNLLLSSTAFSIIEKKPDEPKVNEPKFERSSKSFLYKLRRGPDGKLKYMPNLRTPSFMVNYQKKKKQQQQAESTPKTEVDISQLQFQPIEAMLALVQKERVKLLGAACIILVPVIGLIALPYIKPWSLRFGIPAICTLVATLAFLQGTRSYKGESKPEGSPVTNVLRVFVASTCKMFEDPKQYSELYENQDTNTPKLPHTKGLLSFLDKAAIQLTTEIEKPERHRWRLCTRTEVEETKIIIRMIPIWITFVICGVITSVGNTYFVEQANHMNYKIGKLKLPNSVILVFYEISKTRIKLIYTAIGRYLRGACKEKYAPSIGIALATIFSLLCCITASGIETRRIHVIRSHGLLDKPEDKIPLSVFVLLPQYFLLAGLDSFYENSVTPFLTDQSPPSMKKYLVYLSPGLSGLGIVGSVLSVYVVGKVSEKGGKRNWFQYTLNQSRLDRYYWVLAALSAGNFIWFVFWAVLFPLREPDSNDEEKAGNNDGNEEQTRNQEKEEPIGNREWVDPSLNFVNDLLADNITR
nr:protein NRT1/ PTR FAMILY 5.5-like isoform X2 [Coffea arabica]XP_027100697.1 protein NRT1/ PTR FAMILY 5.5-like isoform X2 [Coffea arabica]